MNQVGKIIGVLLVSSALAMLSCPAGKTGPGVDAGAPETKEPKDDILRGEVDLGVPPVGSKDISGKDSTSDVAADFAEDSIMFDNALPDIHEGEVPVDPCLGVDCDDGDQCTNDACIPPGECVHTLHDGPCDDGNACTAGDWCQQGECVPGEKFSCDDGDPCTNDACSSVEGCVHVLSETTCGDLEECVLGIGACAGAMVKIPAGDFWMGCNEALDSLCEEDEYPYHKIYLDAYEMDITEVTQRAYNACVQAGVCDIPSSPGMELKWDPEGHPDHPAVQIDRLQAETYCLWVGKRLPTEAEWEKAARGGCQWYEAQGLDCEADSFTYPWGNEPATCEYAVMDDVMQFGGSGCGEGNSHPVCSKSPAGNSPYGLCNMAGNVGEWVSDCYLDDYYAVSPSLNPQGPEPMGNTIWEWCPGNVRGGSYWSPVNLCRNASRKKTFADHKHARRGLRCAR